VYVCGPSVYKDHLVIKALSVLVNGWRPFCSDPLQQSYTHRQTHYDNDDNEIKTMMKSCLGSFGLLRLIRQKANSNDSCVKTFAESVVGENGRSCLLRLWLQPENVLFTTSKSHDVKIADFSIAQRIDPNRTVRVLFSTIEYCSAEVLTFAPISYSTDMWTLGVLASVLYVHQALCSRHIIVFV